jgi:hypothetical protein
MKIKQVVIILFLLALAYQSMSQNNLIIAGKADSTNISHHFIPDSIVISIPALTAETDSFLLDVNKDGINDFKFLLTAPYGAMGATDYDCYINGLNDNNIAYGFYDSCFNHRYDMARAFKYGDTINGNMSWVGSGYLVYKSWVINTYDCDFSYSPDTAYIGLRVMSGSDYYYGWIRVADMFFDAWSSTTLSISAYACEINTEGCEDLQGQNNLAEIFPNPSKDMITIETTIPLKENNLTIYNLNGQEIIRQRLKDIKTQIDLGNLPTGIYILKIDSEGGAFVKKVLIER